MYPPAVGGIIGSLVGFLYQWVQARSADPQLAEARRLVVEIESKMNEMEVQGIMNTPEAGAFASLQQHRVK